MISTEQEARAAVAKVGPDAERVCEAISRNTLAFSPFIVRVASEVYAAQGHSRKAAQLHRIYAEWAASRGAAK